MGWLTDPKTQSRSREGFNPVCEEVAGVCSFFEEAVFCEGLEVFVEGTVVAALSGVWNLARLVWVGVSSLSLRLIAVINHIYNAYVCCRAVRP